MGETVNISRIAEEISNDIFKFMGWEICGEMNANWECVNPDHNRPTHPADVVYRYVEPYKNKMTYILTDLKSYGQATITKQNIKKALESLNKSLSCAKLSPDWREKYLNTEKSYDIKGMLFIYNHDGEFQGEKEFSLLLNEASKNIKIDKGNVLVVVGPSRIQYLTNVAHNIKSLVADEKLPHAKHKRGFYYPDLGNEKILHVHSALPLSVENMCANFHIMRYSREDVEGIGGLDIYIKGMEDEVESFMHILDFIRKQNLFQGNTKVRVFVPISTPTTSQNFQKAKFLFTEDMDEELKNKIKQNIFYENCPVIVKQQYFNEEIGMRYE